MKKKGFTLIELIAVIAILAILAIIAVPRVMAYVEKSKKVAIQTEATTIYNAAEAAYNDGKFRVGINNNNNNNNNNRASAVSKYFETIDVHAVAEFLKEEGLLSNVNMDKFKNFHHERGDNNQAITLRDLKTIMNKKPEDLSISSDGKLTGSFDPKTGEYTKDTKEK